MAFLQYTAMESFLKQIDYKVRRGLKQHVRDKFRSLYSSSGYTVQE